MDPQVMIDDWIRNSSYVRLLGSQKVSVGFGLEGP